MNKKIKMIISVMMILVMLVIIAPKSQAAGLVIAFSKSTANVGDTITVTVTGNGVAGKVDLTVSGNATLSENSIFVDGSASTTLKVNGEGDIRVTATASDMADSTTAAPYTGSTGGTITVKSQTPTNPSTNNNTTTNNNTANNNTTTTQKSSNANLANFGIRPNDFKGFTPSKTEYSTTVPNNVASVEIYATKGQTGQKISGTGTKELQEGANTFKVVVTAEDEKTKKTYTLTINRETANTEETPTENGEIEEDVGFGLSDLKIEGIELSPRFSTDVYEYTAKYTGDASKLNITTTPTEEGANVEVTGNESLIDGENIITILVTNASGDKTVTYQLTIQKETVDEEALAKQEELEKQQQMRKYIIIGGAIFLIIVVIIILIIRHRRNIRLAEEYSVPYSGLNDDEYYDDDNNNDNDDDFKKVSKNFVKKENNVANEELLNEEHKNSKEKIKDLYLNQFEDEDTENEDIPRKRHNKGKRFK